MYMTDRLYNKGKDRNNTLTTTEGIPKGDWLYNKVLGTQVLGGAKVMYDKKVPDNFDISTWARDRG